MGALSVRGFAAPAAAALVRCSGERTGEAAADGRGASDAGLGKSTSAATAIHMSHDTPPCDSLKLGDSHLCHL